MEANEYDLLIKDLSSRLPYGVKCLVDIQDDIELFDEERFKPDTLQSISIDGVCTFNNLIGYNFGKFDIEKVKPFLRPMSSMTEEEEIEYDETFATIKIDGHNDSTMTNKSFDWLNEKGFDYRGLIPKGLAMEEQQ